MKLLLYALLFFTGSLFAFQAPVKKDNDIRKMLNEAGVFFNKSEYEKALAVSKNALVLSLRTENDYYTAQSYNAIGAVYNEFSQSERAIEFYKKALHYADKVDNDSLRDWINSNIGSVYYFNAIDIPKGIAYYKKSLYYAEKINDSIQIGFVRLNIASAYFSMGQFASGMDFLKPLSNYLENRSVPEAQMSYLSLLGSYESHLKHIEQAEAYYFGAIAIAEKMEMDSQLANLYDSIAVHFKNHGKIPEYNKYRQKGEALHEIVYGSDAAVESLDDTAIQIELDEYRTLVEKIELQNQKQHEKIQESGVQAILFYGIVGVLLLLVYTLYKTNKIRKRINRELTKVNGELLIAKEKAEENALLKTQFVSTVSHELRTPLYGVVGIANIILEENKEVVDNTHLNSLRFSARYLLALVNDILEISKIEENKIVLEPTIFNLKELIGTINNSLQFIADTNHNQLQIELDPAIPDQLIGDELRLSQILMNLISNALKFTEKGTVRIVAKLENETDGKYYIQFQVNDDGVGIKKENHAIIFEKFVQIERKRGDYQGTGLGLSIVKKLADLFESNIKIESEEHVGTSFSFVIGFEAHCHKGTIEEAIAQSPWKLLVVEDNKINQMVTQKIIEKRGHQCVLVDSGQDAIAIVQQQSFDVILMDINMPVMDGYETSKAIRKLGIKTPIIALTAYDRNEVLEQAATCGIDEVIIKPFKPDDLFQAIGQLAVPFLR